MKTFTKSAIVAVALLFTSLSVMAQEELEITGSVDTYYFADLSGTKNRTTSFAADDASVSIGMVDLGFSQVVGKASFVGEVAFGPRAANTAPGAVQNLYVSYSFTDELTISGGFMGTFIGYEVISPAANFNYTASYLFSNGPFQNPGVKLDYAVSESFAVMVGAFNDPWDSYTGNAGVDNLGAQVYVAPVDGMDIWLNTYLGENYKQWDITAGYQASDALYIGANISQNMEYAGDPDGGFFGAAGYLQFAMSDDFSLGLRYENFKFEADGSEGINSITVSGNISAGPMVVIPEVRFDSQKAGFVDGDGNAADNFVELGIAAVYAF